MDHFLHAFFINDDIDIEPYEEFTVELFNPNGTLIDFDTAVVTIFDNV